MDLEEFQRKIRAQHAIKFGGDIYSEENIHWALPSNPATSDEPYYVGVDEGEEGGDSFEETIITPEEEYTKITVGGDMTMGNEVRYSVYDVYIISKSEKAILNKKEDVVAKNKDEARFKANVDHTIRTGGYDFEDIVVKYYEKVAFVCDEDE